MKEFQPQVSLKSVRTIHISLLIGISLFLIVTLNIVEEMTPFQFNVEDPLMLALVFLTIAVIPASIVVPKLYLRKNPPYEGIQSKLTLFQTMLIIKAALWAGVAQLGIVIFMISGNPTPLTIAILAILVIATYYPSIESIRKTVNLSQDELIELK